VVVGVRNEGCIPHVRRPRRLLNSDDDSTDPGQGGKGLRAQLEAALAREKALNERLAKTEQAERSRSLADLFAKHAVPELARDFFPKDAELTDESVTGFVEKYGQLWGAQAQPATTPPDSRRRPLRCSSSPARPARRRWLLSPRRPTGPSSPKATSDGRQMIQEFENAEPAWGLNPIP
jgi:hypothetical protein